MLFPWPCDASFVRQCLLEAIALGKLLGLCLPCCPTNLSSIFGVPSGLWRGYLKQSPWLWCQTILPFYKGIAFFFQKLADFLIVFNQTSFGGPMSLAQGQSLMTVTICLNWVHFSFYVQSVVHKHAVCYWEVNEISPCQLCVPFWWCWMWI